jgi:hypothetical protein
VPKRLKEYLTMLWRFWGSRISGPILALVGFGLIVINLCIPSDSPAIAAKALLVGAWITLGAAGFMVLIAQYDVWDAERDKYEVEVLKNARPEIQGDASNFRSGKYADSPEGCQTEIWFELNVTNCRQVTTNVRDLELDGTKMECGPQFSNVYGFPYSQTIGMDHPKSDLLDVELRPGFNIPFRGHARISIPGREWRDFEFVVDLAALQINLVDGFGIRHPIGIRPGAKLTVGSV